MTQDPRPSPTTYRRLVKRPAAWVFQILIRDIHHLAVDIDRIPSIWSEELAETGFPHRSQIWRAYVQLRLLVDFCHMHRNKPT